jgi:starch phosphorylase
MLREYVTDFYRPAENDLAARLADGVSPAREIDAWAQRLTSGWSGVRFGSVDVTASDGGWEVSAEVFLNQVAVDDVRVELYADPCAAGGEPACVRMETAGALPGTSHGFLFKARIPTGRPPGDWTARVIPASRVAHVPAELALITWQR